MTIFETEAQAEQWVLDNAQGDVTVLYTAKGHEAPCTMSNWYQPLPAPQRPWVISQWPITRLRKAA